MSNVTVVLNGYNKPEAFQHQVQAITNQTLKPAEIMLWQNATEGFDSNLTAQFTTAVANRNLGVWARFAYALLARTEYVCVFDDDTMPGSKWLQNCVDTIQTHEGLLGTIGLRYKSSFSYLPHDRWGWDNPNEETVQVDIVGHAWFFKREWLNTFWRESPPLQENFEYVGEDMHFSYTLQKYLGLNTYVPPHPREDREMWGSIHGWHFGNINPASAIPGRLGAMNAYYNYIVANGFRIINEP